MNSSKTLIDIVFHNVDLSVLRSGCVIAQPGRNRIFQRILTRNPDIRCISSIVEMCRTMNFIWCVSLKRLDSSCLFQYMTLCQDYHKNCFEILNRLVPELEKWRDKSSLLPPFETSLEKHLNQTRRKVALPIELTTSWLHHNQAYKEHGVFRVGGNMKVVRLLQVSFFEHCKFVLHFFFLIIFRLHILYGEENNSMTSVVFLDTFCQFRIFNFN